MTDTNSFLYHPYVSLMRPEATHGQVKLTHTLTGQDSQGYKSCQGQCYVSHLFNSTNRLELERNMLNSDAVLEQLSTIPLKTIYLHACETETLWIIITSKPVTAMPPGSC